MRQIVKRQNAYHRTTVKKQLLESIVIKVAVESGELNREAKEVQDRKKAAKVIQESENINKTKEKGILGIVYIIKARFLKNSKTEKVCKDSQSDRDS